VHLREYWTASQHPIYAHYCLALFSPRYSSSIHVGCSMSCYREPDRQCLGHFCIYTFIFQNKKSTVKMNRLAFVSINRMRAGQSSLKANLSRFNIASTDVVTGCKRRNISSAIINCTRNHGQQWWTFVWEQQKEYPMTVTELLRLEEKKKICARCVTS
jgi:hypothetical protein